MTDTSPNSHCAKKNQDPIPKATVTHDDVGVFVTLASSSLSLSLISSKKVALSTAQMIPRVKITTLVVGDVQIGFSVMQNIRRTNFKKKPMTIPPNANSLKLKNENIKGAVIKYGTERGRRDLTRVTRIIRWKMLCWAKKLLQRIKWNMKRFVSGFVFYVFNCLNHRKCYFYCSFDH